MSVVFGKLWEVQYSSKPMGSCPHLRAETSLAPVTPSTAWSASEASAFFSAWPRTMASSASKSTWPWPSMKKWGDLWGFYDFYGDVFQLNPRGQDLWCGLMWLRTIYHINLGYLWLIHSSKGCISWSRIPHGKIHGRIGHHSSIAHHQWLVVVELNHAYRTERYTEGLVTIRQSPTISGLLLWNLTLQATLHDVYISYIYVRI